MTTFRYRVENTIVESNQELEEWLNGMGDGGWELVNVHIKKIICLSVIVSFRILRSSFNFFRFCSFNHLYCFYLLGICCIASLTD